MPIFDPLTQPYALWQIFISFVTLYNFVFIPLFLCFKEANFNIVLILVRTASPIFLGLDILLQANTSFYDKHNSITNHKDIFIRYLRSTFIFDLVSLLFLLLFDPAEHKLNSEADSTVTNI